MEQEGADEGSFEPIGRKTLPFALRLPLMDEKPSTLLEELARSRTAVMIYRLADQLWPARNQRVDRRK